KPHRGIRNIKLFSSWVSVSGCETLFVENSLDSLRHRLTRIDILDPIAQRPLDDRTENGIVRAPKHQRIHSAREQSGKILFCDLKGYRVIEPTFFCERHE